MIWLTNLHEEENPLTCIAKLKDKRGIATVKKLTYIFPGKNQKTNLISDAGIKEMK